MPRERDDLKVELIDPVDGVLGVLDRFTSFELSMDLEAPAQASFEIGDDGSYDQVGRFVQPGGRYKVTLNGTTVMIGTVETTDIPMDSQAGAVLRYVIRTSLSQAAYASARPVSMTDATLGAFVGRLYEQLGLSQSDFIFRASLARDLLTGASKGSGKSAGSNDEVKLARYKLDAARVRPPETIYNAADRHLRRFGLMHWDGPDGRIVIGAPNDRQEPTYTLSAFRGERSVRNNLISLSRTIDYSQVPSSVTVSGVGGGKDYSRSRVIGRAFDTDVGAAGLHHPVIVLAESIQNQAAADSAARRELVSRSRNKDHLTAVLDGLSWWDTDNGRRVPWGVDTTASVQSDLAGGDIGTYYVQSVSLRRDAIGGDVSTISLARQGAWTLEQELDDRPQLQGKKR